MVKYFVVGSGYNVTNKLDIAQYVSQDVCFAFVEKPNADASAWGASLVPKPGIDTINGEEVVDSGQSWRGSLSCSGVGKYCFDFNDYGKCIKTLDELPEIDFDEYNNSIIVLGDTNRFVLLALYEYYECKPKLIIKESTSSKECIIRNKQELLDSEFIREAFLAMFDCSSGWYRASAFNWNKLNKFANNKTNLIKDAVLKYVNAVIEKNELCEKMLAKSYKLHAYGFNTILSSLSSFIFGILNTEIIDKSVSEKFIESIHPNFVEPRLALPTNKDVNIKNLNIYIDTLGNTNSLAEKIMEINMKIFKSRPKTMKELHYLLYSTNSNNEYKLSEAQSKEIVKILNRNKANKELSRVVELCKSIFGDTLNWDDVDSVIKDKVFSEPVKIGKYTIGKKSVEEESVPESKLVDIVGGFNDRYTYDTYVNLQATIAYMVLAPYDEVRGNAKSLSINWYTHMNNKYTSTGGTDWDTRKAFKIMKTKDGKLFKDDTVKLVLDELFKLVRRENRIIVYRKFFIMVNDLDLDYLCNDDLYKNDKMYKKVKMEAKMNK